MRLCLRMLTMILMLACVASGAYAQEAYKKAPGVDAGDLQEPGKALPTMAVLAENLLRALDEREPVHINQTFSAGGQSEFDCESSSNKVQAACRMACGVAQNLGCGCSTTENGCSCECHGVD